MHFAISKENAEKVLNTLGEIPAKHVLGAIDIMRNIFPIAEELVEKIFTHNAKEDSEAQVVLDTLPHNSEEKFVNQEAVQS